MARFIPLALILCFALVPSESFAADSKVRPAESCVRVSGGTPALFFGTMDNASTTSAMSIDCPLPRDNTTAPLTSAFVKVRDLNAAQSVACQLVGVYQSGTGTFTASESKSTSASGVNSNWVNLTFGNLPGFNPGSQGYYYIQCTVPVRTANGNSSVAMYQITEP